MLSGSGCAPQQCDVENSFPCVALYSLLPGFRGKSVLKIAGEQRIGCVPSGLNGVYYLFHRECDGWFWFQASICAWLSTLSMVTRGASCVTVLGQDRALWRGHVKL
ncbi:hypothetical protein FGO68_gene155 [Halteria grandinella]|uniref:Uncharacterized protein n=1 Tax=Halteria grandinella TaxID=5974 RepID=A0A8J8N9A9_HALGN|nr:hypothetical protein FGO68_gene155 [Halteria grandinella]